MKIFIFCMSQVFVFEFAKERCLLRPKMVEDYEGQA